MVLSEGSYGFLQGWQHRRQNEVNLSTIPDLEGKVALVTGANAGIGKVATQVLASKGAKVFMACRSCPKAEAAISDIKKETPAADLQFLHYDASSLSSAHSAGLSFLTHDLPLDMLLLNAGAIFDKPIPTKDGLESIFAVNYLAHFALTLALLPALEQGAKLHGDVRVSTTASAGFTMHPDPQSLHVSEAEIAVDNKKFWWKDAMPMYGRSKTCQILFASELSRRLRERTEWGRVVRSNAVHPGTVSTGLNSALKKSWVVWILETVVYALAAIPSDAGAVNMLYAAASEEVKDKDISGKYFTPYGFVNNAPDGTPATDGELAKALWTESVGACRRFVPRIEIPAWIL